MHFDAALYIPSLWFIMWSITSVCSCMASGAVDSPSQSSDDTSPERAMASTCSSNPVLDVLWAGDIYTYTFPSFTVLFVILKHMEVNAKDGQSNFDAFMRVVGGPLEFPATIIIVEACYVDVSTCSIATTMGRGGMYVSERSRGV